MLEILSSVKKGRGVIPAEITGIRFVFLEGAVNASNNAVSNHNIQSIELHNEGMYYGNEGVTVTASTQANTTNYAMINVIEYEKGLNHYWSPSVSPLNNGNPDRSCWIQLTFPVRKITGFDVYFRSTYQCKNYDVEVQLPSGQWVYATTIRRSTPWGPVTKTPLNVYIRPRLSSYRQSSMSFDYRGLNIPLNLGPGPQNLIGYYINPLNPFRQHGFFGEVASTDFITGDALASAVGLSSAGTSQNSTAAWLKFLIDGKIVFIPKLTIRHSISWQQIYQAGCVYADGTTGLYPSGTPVVQNKQVTAGGSLFNVGLLSGTNVDPHPDTNGYDLVTTHGCEWNRLFYNICRNNASRPQTSQEGPEWATYTESELGIISGSETYTWCKESHARGATYRVLRGGAVTYLNRNPVTAVYTTYGWRPKLELYNLHQL